MITLTDAAAAQIRQVLDAWGVPQETALRLRNSGGKLSLMFDTREPGDLTVMRDGQVLLVYDKNVERFLDGRVLDLHPNPAGGVLALA